MWATKDTRKSTNLWPELTYEYDTIKDTIAIRYELILIDVGTVKQFDYKSALKGDSRKYQIRCIKLCKNGSVSLNDPNGQLK